MVAGNSDGRAARAAAPAEKAGESNSMIAVRNGAYRLSKKFPWAQGLLASMEGAQVRVAPKAPTHLPQQIFFLWADFPRHHFRLQVKIYR